MNYTINEVSVNDILRKEAFKRAIPSQLLTQSITGRPTGGASSEYNVAHDPILYELFNQADFMREYDVNAHKINSMKYYPNPLVKDDNGRHYAKVKTRIAIGWQEYIHLKRLTALTGNNVNIRLVSHKNDPKSQDLLVRFREGWEIKSIETLIHDFVSADGKVGDVAANIYLSGNTMGWRIFSFENGDTLYPHYDPLTGELAIFGRRYSSRDNEGNIVEYLDVWDRSYYCRFINDCKDKEKGWTMDTEPIAHHFPMVPIVYDRYGGPFWANSQANIDAHEMAISQLCENNMAYALRILYSFGEDMDMKSTLDGTPTRIDSPDPNARVGFLEPADASASFTLQLDTLRKNITRGSFVVETPELKSGSDLSSLTVKMLFADAYLKALDDAAHFQPALDRIVSMFKFAYGIEIGQTSDFNTLLIKAEMFPYIFQSETEIVNGIVQLKGIGALSRKSATEMAYEYGYGIIDENSRLLQEEHDELVATATTVKDTNIIAQSR